MKIVVPSILTFLMIVGGVSAVVVIITIAVNANITFPQTINYGPILIGEEKTRILGFVNSTVTDKVNYTTVCDNPSAVTGVLILPVGSTNNNIPFELNKTVFIGPNISVGKMELKFRGISQALVNCTGMPGVSGNTNITWVEKFE